MNKKIKIIELLNKIANGEEVPEKIKFENKTYKYYKERQDYIVYIDEDEFYGETLLFNIMSSHFIPELLETEVEILEDNTEEIEGLKYEEQNLFDDKGNILETQFILRDEDVIKTISDLVKAVNGIRKDLNK